MPRRDQRKKKVKSKKNKENKQKGKDKVVRSTIIIIIFSWKSL